MSVSPQAIPLSSQDISQAEIDAVLAVLRSDRLSLGPRVEQFEADLARRVGRRHGVAVNSGTSGLHLCVRAMGLCEGQEVITTPFSFIATTNCLLFERVRPVFVDIDERTYNMDPDAAERAITPRTKAMLPVEVFGSTAHFDRYEQIARRHGLGMIEDCCEALGAQLNGRPAGRFGDCGVFAFYPNKQITTGEGGLIVTDDDRIAELCRSMRNQGRATEAWLSHARLGYNYRLSEMNAAMGVVQLSRLDEFLSKRRQAAEQYNHRLGDCEDLRLPPMAGQADASWFVYVVRLADRFSEADRDAVLTGLRAQGIGCNNYFAPIHLQPFIRELLGAKPGDFPVTERVAARTIALPFHTQITGAQIQRVCRVLKDSIGQVKR